MIKKENDNLKYLVVKNYYIANILLSTLIIACLGHLLFFLFQLFSFSSFEWNRSLGEGGFVFLRLTLLYTPIFLLLCLLKLFIIGKIPDVYLLQKRRIVKSLTIMILVLPVVLNLYILLYNEAAILGAAVITSVYLVLMPIQIILWEIQRK